MPDELQLQINGQSRTLNLRSPATVEELVSELALRSDRIALEINGEIVPRSHWTKAVAQNGDRVEIVHFVGGGSDKPKRPTNSPGKHILKNLGAIFSSNVVSLFIEYVQFPLFLHSYGKLVYADWIALSSAVSYLSTLNFGLQTYVNQDLAVRYNSGEMGDYHIRQSTALRALLGTAMLVAAACLVIFFLPIERWLNLSISHFAATLTLYFIALQILMGSMVFSYFSNAFNGVGLAYRGNYWNNAQRFFTGVLLCVLAIYRQPLFVLAIAQFALYVVIFALLLIDLKRSASEIFPTLKYWDPTAIGEMIKPSVYFGFITAGNFLAFEMPLLLLRKFAGATPVIIFSAGRKIFSSGRQILTGMSQSMGPEVTRLYGQKNWELLYKLYDYSERVIFFLIVAVNVPLFLASPMLIQLWSRTTGLFNLPAYALLGFLTCVLCIKEHKNMFQFSTNMHINLGRVMVYSYALMTVVSIGTIHLWGVIGFTATWLVVESYLTFDTVRQNKLLFAGHQKISVDYIVRLLGLTLVAFVIGFVVLHAANVQGWGLPLRLAVCSAESLAAIGMAWYLFHMNGMTAFLKERVQRKFGRGVPA